MLHWCRSRLFPGTDKLSQCQQFRCQDCVVEGLNKVFDKPAFGGIGLWDRILGGRYAVELLSRAGLGMVRGGTQPQLTVQ